VGIMLSWLTLQFWRESQYVDAKCWYASTGIQAFTRQNISTVFLDEQTTTTKKQTPWSESASELYRPSNRRLSAKWLPTFAIKGATWSAWRIPTAVFSVF
jgi:hypothetical protein